LTRSERERTLLQLISSAQLPRPVTNIRQHGYLLDAYWPAEGLVVEFDGWRGHGHRLAFESDRKRDQVLVAAGLRVLRVTDRQLKYEPVAVAARIAQALCAAR
jgi:very-short-patch-repair endonuclease